MIAAHVENLWISKGFPQSLGKVLSNFTTIIWITAKAVTHITTRAMLMNFDIKKVCLWQTEYFIDES